MNNRPYAPASRLIATMIFFTTIACFTSTLQAEPHIACPPMIETVYAAPKELITLGLPVDGADSVTVSIGGWSDNKLSFHATRPGIWEFTIKAWGGATATYCMVKVNVHYIGGSDEYADQPVHLASEPDSDSPETP